MGVLEAKPLSTPVVLLHLLSLLAAAVSAKLKTSNIQFDYFSDADRKALQFDGNATIFNDALQVTPDSVDPNDPAYLTNQAGRILYKHPFKLWEGQNETDRVGSFNVSFLFNLYRAENNTSGEGLAFVVAPDLNLPLNSFGRYLGLTNYTTDGKAANCLVAVELDTFKEDSDPDSNHVGLNINSVNSTKITPLTFPLVGQGLTSNFFNVWVQYDGIKKVIDVYIAQQVQQKDPTPPRPAIPILTSNLELRGVVNQNSYFGFSASTSNGTQLNCVLRWNLTVEHYYDDKPKWVKIGLAVGISTVVVVLVLLVLVYYVPKKMSVRRKKQEMAGKVIECTSWMPKKYEYKDLRRATNKFDKKMKLGQGGFGVVYKGILGNGKEVAVKMFSRERMQEGQDDFLVELEINSRVSHINLLQLRGWCHKHNDKLMLVFDYMPHRSLDKHLFGDDADIRPLSWDRRQKILLEVASALNYLHCHFKQKVIHRDVKASNIMLDSDFTAKLGDFGLALAFDNERTSYGETMDICGTRGYMAPELCMGRVATEKSDVYAFGAVILEVVCGKKTLTQIDEHQFLVDWAWALHHERRLLEAVDNRLGEDYAKEEVEKVLLLGLACSHPVPSERPNTHDIVEILLGSMPVPDVPLSRPPVNVLVYNTPVATDTTSFATAPSESTSIVPMAINSESQQLFFTTGSQCIREMSICSHV